MELRKPSPDERHAPLDLAPEEFRPLGHGLVDEIAGFLASLPQRPVTSAASPRTCAPSFRKAACRKTALRDRLLRDAAQLLFDRSLLNGHPRFFGYITSSAAPIGALADLLAASVNPNVGAWSLSPLATEIEEQTVAWIAEMLGYPGSCGGLLVSGGNMANVVCLLAARKARLPWDVRSGGMFAANGRTARITRRPRRTPGCRRRPTSPAWAPTRSRKKSRDLRQSSFGDPATPVTEISLDTALSVKRILTAGCCAAASIKESLPDPGEEPDAALLLSRTQCSREETSGKARIGASRRADETVRATACPTGVELKGCFLEHAVM